jgi:hypothetical protein
MNQSALYHYLKHLNREPRLTTPRNKGPKTPWAAIGALVLLAALAKVSYGCEINWTPEQWRSARIAYHAGEPYGLGYTIAAACVRESFVGPLIIRTNTRDGAYGSWGLCHMKLDTAMAEIGETNSWQARATLAPRLMRDDYFATSLAAAYMARHVERLGWRSGIARYNGGSQEYARIVGDRALELERCGVFG